MKVFNLFNRNNNIGKVNANPQSIKNLSKKKYKLLTTLILTANIITSTLTGCSNNKKDESSTILSPIVVEPLTQNEERLYLIKDEDVDQLVNIDYLNTYSYIPIDTIETRHEFIVDNLIGLKDIYPQYANYLDSLFNQYTSLYYQYISSTIKDAFYTKKFIEEKQNHIIDEIERISDINYYPEAVKYDEYIEEKYKNDQKLETYYIVKEGDTLSEIIDRYVNSREEYVLAFFYAINNNIFEKDDFNILKPGQKLKLAFVGKEDYDLLGLEEDNSIFAYINFISNYKDGVKALNGDLETYNLNKKVTTEIAECIKLYDDKNYVEDQFLIRLKDLCNDIYLLTGDIYTPHVIHKDKKRM